MVGTLSAPRLQRGRLALSIPSSTTQSWDTYTLHPDEALGRFHLKRIVRLFGEVKAILSKAEMGDPGMVKYQVFVDGREAGFFHLSFGYVEGKLWMVVAGLEGEELREYLREKGHNIHTILHEWEERTGGRAVLATTAPGAFSQLFAGTRELEVLRVVDKENTILPLAHDWELSKVVKVKPLVRVYRRERAAA